MEGVRPILEWSKKGQKDEKERRERGCEKRARKKR